MYKKFLISLLLHMFAMWLILNISHLEPMLYASIIRGQQPRVGSAAHFIWQYFLDYNYNRHPLWVWIWFFVPIVELNYWFIYRKRSFYIGAISSFIMCFIIVVSNAPVWDFSNILNFNAQSFDWVLILTAYAIIYCSARKLIYLNIQKKDLQLQQSQTELNALKVQLNPHFFFNSLNYLYGTALIENATITAKAIDILSDMMRYTITGANENFAPLADELNFIKNYIYLQKVRLPEKNSIRIETSINEAQGEQKIAPLLLLPFIENAFKYGMSIDYPCVINIVIDVSADELKLKVVNTIIGHTVHKGNNTGINNTRKRLDLLYDNKYTLKHSEANSEYTAILSVKL